MAPQRLKCGYNYKETCRGAAGHTWYGKYCHLVATALSLCGLQGPTGRGTRRVSPSFSRVIQEGCCVECLPCAMVGRLGFDRLLSRVFDVC